jgi:hypothetical protein
LAIKVAHAVTGGLDIADVKQHAARQVIELVMAFEQAAHRFPAGDFIAVLEN